MRRILLLILISCLTQRCISQNPCEDGTNGGCSDTCLYRNNEVECTCPCLYQLSADNQNCELLSSSQCGTSYGFLIDSSSSIDFFCSYNMFLPVPMTVFPEWDAWKVLVDATISGIVDLTGSTSVGIQLYADLLTIDTIKEYNAIPVTASTVAQFEAALMNITDRDQSICTGSVTYSEPLRRIVEFDPIANWVYSGPGPLPDADLNTRVVIAMVYAGENSVAASDVVTQTEVAREQFDAVIVITRKYSGANEENNIRQARAGACGDPDALCDRVFYLDAPNDFGVALSSTAVHDVVNSVGCLGRQRQAIEMEILSCNSTGMVWRIPKCLLRGMDLDDLEFPSNTTCKLCPFGEEGATYYDLTLPYGSCDMETEVISNPDGTFTVELAQTVTQKMDPNITLFPVSFTGKCSFNFEEVSNQSVVVRPIQPETEQSGNLTQEVDFPLDLELYRYANYSELATPPVAVEVNCPLYMLATTTIPAGLESFMHRCYVSNSYEKGSADVEYDLYDSGCELDPTFDILDSNPTQTEFKFDMLEFAATFNKTHSIEKWPLYLHCCFKVCGENIVGCEPICDKRKRRDAASEDDSFIYTTAGPFTVIPAKTSEEPQKEAEKVEDQPKQPVFDIKQVEDQPKQPVSDIKQVEDQPKQPVSDIEKVEDQPKQPVSDIEKVEDQPKQPVSDIKKIEDQPKQPKANAVKVTDQQKADVIDTETDDAIDYDFDEVNFLSENERPRERRIQIVIPTQMWPFSNTFTIFLTTLLIIAALFTFKRKSPTTAGIEVYPKYEKISLEDDTLPEYDENLPPKYEE